MSVRRSIDVEQSVLLNVLKLHGTIMLETTLPLSITSGRICLGPSWVSWYWLLSQSSPDSRIPGIGHSMGGNVIVNLALMHPRLLSTVVVYEPVINMNSATMEFSALGPMTTKPDMWPSRKEAEVYFRKNKFYAKWDPRAMDAWLKYGLRPLPTALYPMTTDEHSGAVTLVTTRHQEALSFARAAYPPPGSSMKAFNPTSSAHPDLGLDRNPQNLFYRPEVTSTYAQLAYLRPSCYYIYGDRSHLSSAVAQERAAKFVITGTGTGGNGGFRKGGVKETLVSGSHFVPLERPGEIASLMNAWLSSEIRRWREEEKAESTARKALPAEKRATVSDEWYYWIQKVAKPIGTTSKL